DAEPGAVDLSHEIEADALRAVVLRGLAHGAASGDRKGGSLDGEVAGDRDLVPRYAHVGGVERDLGRALCIEEVRRLKMAAQVLLLDRDAGDRNRPGQRGAAVLTHDELGVDRREAAAERAGDVLHREARVGMNWVEVPCPGGNGTPSCLCRAQFESPLRIE